MRVFMMGVCACACVVCLSCVLCVLCVVCARVHAYAWRFVLGGGSSSLLGMHTSTSLGRGRMVATGRSLSCPHHYAHDGEALPPACIATAAAVCFRRHVMRCAAAAISSTLRITDAQQAEHRAGGEAAGGGLCHAGRVEPRAHVHRHRGAGEPAPPTSPVRRHRGHGGKGGGSRRNQRQRLGQGFCLPCACCSNSMDTHTCCLSLWWSTGT